MRPRRERAASHRALARMELGRSPMTRSRRMMLGSPPALALMELALAC
jgi:hypothetical protein